MEKTVKLTWSEVMKWIVLVAGIASTYAIMQTKIAHLEEGRTQNKASIERLELRMEALEGQINGISTKTNTIYDDVKVIKDAIINDSFSHK